MTSKTISGRRRWSRRVLVLFTVGGLLGALRLRGRLAALRTVEPGHSRITGTGTETGAEDAWVLLTAEGVHVDTVTRQDAVAYAEQEGLDALDLVPGDLPSERAMDLARLVDPATFRRNRLAPGRGAQHALLVRRSLLVRADLLAVAEPSSDLDPVAFAATAQTVKRYAPATTDLAVAPVLRAAPSASDPEKRLALLRSMFTVATPAVVGLPAAAYVVLGVGIVVNPLWGAAALAAWSALPALATSGTPLRPADQPAHSLRRIVDEPRFWVQTLLGRWRPPATAASLDEVVEDLRPVYADLVADGTERFFEPRREDCPWCGSSELSVRVSTIDRYQAKPGRFSMDECGECGHTFQNPRLSLEGLDYYYRDFYDGISDDSFETIFSFGAGLEHGRAEMLSGLHEPQRWLDVGTGHGHFPLLAAEIWPETRFEGLDLGESVEEAERRGWIAAAHRGFLPDLAGELEGQFDVVSMHHELEHTRDPRAELAAAAKVLQPGGFLEIEVPDPEFPLSRVLGERWLPFFQPQHQHMVTIGNLSKELEGLGFDVVRTRRFECHRAIDLTAAAWFVVNGAAPADDLPWLERPSPRAGLRRLLTFTLGLPLLAAAALGDQLVGVWAKNADRGNAYRVLAQKRQ
jgi:SAM-dependent methyltransferase